MKVTIEIPKEFEADFKRDRFADALNRLSTDAHALAGNYEKETAAMLIEAFKQVQPEPTGIWETVIPAPGEKYYRATCCGTMRDEPSKFCPNCGAKMINA